MKYTTTVKSPMFGLAASAIALLAAANFSCVQAQETAMPDNTISGPIERQSEYGAPYINNWLLLGTFDNDAQNVGFEKAFIDETKVAPQVSLQSNGQTWRYFDDRLFSRNYDDYNDLFSYYRIKQDKSITAKVVYAHSYVYSPQAQNVQLRVGADTSFKAWVNGAPIVASTDSTPTSLIMDAARAHLNSGRDYVVAKVSLNQGWNRLLLKVANREAGRFGFYARLTQTDGTAAPGLTYSTGGGSGELAISNASMPEAKTGDLPVAYQEWAYVGARVDTELLTKLAMPSSGPDGQKPPAIENMGIGFHHNKALAVQSSFFKFLAQGGNAPYKWSLVKGKLPAGLTLAADGTLQGTPTASTAVGNYPLTVRVQDAGGKSVQKAFVLPLKQRPNRRMETMRLTGLIHGPEQISKEDVPKVAQLLKKEGYGLAFPISYNNGDLLFRWPYATAVKKTDTDVDATYKAAFEKEGIGFGMYIGNLNTEGDPNFNVNQQILVIEDALRRYHPKAFWFDWLGLDGTSLDSLFSMIHSYDPETVIVLNGSGRFSNGDWDIISFEGWQAWGGETWSTWPSHVPWPKKHTPESWRLAVNKEWSVGRGIESDWNEMLRVQLSMIGEGFIADMDHTSFLGPDQGLKFEDLPLVKLHTKMAEWANPKGLPPLTEAYTQVDAGPLNQGKWGYDTINLKRDTIYLIALKNPRGKWGLPAGGTLDLGPVEAKIKSVTLMNTGAKLPFTQNANVTINIKDVTPDPVANIFKIELQKPLTEAQLAKPKVLLKLEDVNKPTPEGNLASFKPSWLMSADGTRELTSSGGQYAKYGNDDYPTSGAQAAWEYAWSYKVDLQKEYDISRIVVSFDKKGWATVYNVLISLDGKEWQTIHSEPNGVSGEHTYRFEPTKARYVRVQGLKPDGPDQIGAQMRINDLQVFEK